MQLDKLQLSAVEHTGSPLLITAGPGSGKTRVITERIKFLMKTGLKPSEILCLTFSEKAANELKERLENDADIKKKIDISEMGISTYHSFCRRLLQDNTVYTGRGMRGGILNRQVFLVWGIRNIDKFGFDEHIEIGNNAGELIEKMMEGIGVFTDELISPEMLDDYVQEKLKGSSVSKDVEEWQYLHLLNNLVKIYKQYIKYKRECDIMDFDDLIVDANHLLGDPEKSHSLKLAQLQYKHILIDEFQDNNFAQFSIAKKLVKDGNITVVGDADQNIYRFQGAYTQIFKDFRNTFKNYTLINLTSNWRNPKSVINLSTQLLLQDEKREKKEIKPTKNDKQKVNVIECTSEFAQAEFIKNKINELREKNPKYTFNDFAILSRKQTDGLNVAQILASNGIPVKYVGKAEVHRSSNAKVLFSFLRIIADPTNAITSITRILQEYGISELNISLINQEATNRARFNSNGDYAFEVLSNPNIKGLTQKIQISEIHAMIKEFMNIAKDNLASNTIYQIIRNKTGIYKKIANDDSIENFLERSILNNIFNNALDYEKAHLGEGISGFLDFVDELEKFDVETTRDTAGSEAIQISTIHKSKGLEFKNVFIIDVANAKIPLRYTEKPFYVPQELAQGVIPASEPKEEFRREERRVLYVGMTRAEDNLFLMYPTQYENRVRASKASEFLQNLKPQENSNVEFTMYDSNDSSNISTTFDAIEIIKNDKISQIIKNLHSEQYESTIQKILDLATIKFLQNNKTMSGFSTEKLLKQTPSDDLQSQLDGTKPPNVGFQSKNLSFTKFTAFAKCPKQFWYQYVLGALPASQQSPALYKGGIFHQIVEESAKRQKEGNVDDVAKLLAELDTQWDSTKYRTLSVKKEKEDRQSLAPALETYQKWSSSNYNEIISLELSFTIYIGGFQVKGKIDRVEKTPDGEFIVIDYKTGKRGKTGKLSNDDNLRNIMQSNLYSLALKDNPDYGKLPIKAKFFYVERPSEWQLVEYDVSLDKINETIDTLTGYVDSIQNQEFDPTPGMFTCKWCEYSDICDDAV